EKEEERDRMWPLCEQLAKRPNILKFTAKQLRKHGVVGERANVYAVQLQCVSRVFPAGYNHKALGVTIAGESSIGKSFTSQSAIYLCPEHAYYTLTAASEKALIYEPIGTFKHRIVFLVEATALLKDENSLLALCIRALQSEQEFRYPVPVL